MFVDLVHPEERKMSQHMRNKIDRIGWRHFTEGKLPNALRDIQVLDDRRTHRRMGYINPLLEYMIVIRCHHTRGASSPTQ